MSLRTLALALSLVLVSQARPAAAQGSQFPDGTYLVVVQAGDGIDAPPGVYLMSFDGH